MAGATWYNTPNLVGRRVMRAIVVTEYGPPDVLQLQEVEKPAPQDNEILIRVCATSVNYGDLAARNFRDISPSDFHMPLLFWVFGKLSFGLRAPKVTVLGSEFSGIVEAVGEAVTRFKPGDAVFGYLGQGMGAYAEYLVLAEDATVATKPANMSFEEAAVVPYGSIVALYLLRRVNIRPGQKVLVNGASGAIGSAAVQIAKHYGAEVTGVAGAPRLEFVKSLGADRVIDYRQADFTQSGETYDVIFDILGKSSFARAKRALKPGGRYLLASFKGKQLLQMLRTSVSGDKKVVCALAPGGRDDLLAAQELMEAGAIKAVIDRRFPLEEAAEAHDYVEGGHKKGQVVIDVSDCDGP